ncbi:MAG: phosphodiesterase [Clostridiales bacterium]|nr:phosphodiesterase [Clostridiales bacterium]
MKIMIASDIHGSEYYTEKLLKAYRASGAEKLVLLGDLLYHGPRNDLPHDYAPKKVIELLNGAADELLCVRGNCDTEVDQMVLSFPIMADYAVLYLDGRMFYLTHGHKYGFDNFPNIRRGDAIIQGHTHVPVLEERGGILCVNPGSVSIPKAGSAHQCLLYENGEFKEVVLG